MGRKKKILPTIAGLAGPAATSQTAITEWQDIQKNPPPYNKIISVRTKTGQIINDCALIPDSVNGDVYVNEYGKDIKDVSQWRDFDWKYGK